MTIRDDYVHHSSKKSTTAFFSGGICAFVLRVDLRPLA